MCAQSTARAESEARAVTKGEVGVVALREDTSEINNSNLDSIEVMFRG